MKVRLKILLVINFLDLLCSFHPLFFLIYFIDLLIYFFCQVGGKTRQVLY